jgi:NAD(P) transhydrogenase subunit beta
LIATTLPNSALVCGYLVSSVCFVIALKALSSPRRARWGNLVGVAGMVVAVGLTLVDQHAGPHGIIVIGMVVGTVIGVPIARLVRMTAMPQLVAVFNGVGGAAAALVSTVTFLGAEPNHPSAVHMIEITLGAAIGCAAFAGSMVAFAKLQDLVTGRPVIFPG